MTPLPTHSSGSSTPNGDDSSFKRKLINLCIFGTMITSALATHSGWSDLAVGADQVKWILELITLLLL